MTAYTRTDRRLLGFDMGDWSILGGGLALVALLNRGAVAHHPLARAASAAPSRARARRFGASGLTRALNAVV